jgi:hypothetical protein
MDALRYNLLSQSDTAWRWLSGDPAPVWSWAPPEAAFESVGSTSGVGEVAFTIHLTPAAEGSVSGVASVVLGIALKPPAAGSTTATVVPTISQRLKAPQNFKATRTSANWTQVTVSWDAVSGATGYTIKRFTGYRSGTATTTNTASTSVTVTGLTAMQTYTFQVCAYNASVNGPNSPFVFVHAKQETP